ncbi:CvpA family protein [Polycladidibacter hongkongensis]|uniref:CvpA family protein n=1 Tax=Polycladidibacter hongkongensis TaxID=1647556 RepID=UPI00082BBD28|nr:CvpA family protein [Pseudovibrio hongkongensis]
MPITLLDGILLVIMLLSAFLAMVRGFVREVLSIASWVAAAVSAYYFYGSVEPMVAPYVGEGTLATIIAIGAVFVLTLIVVSFITMFLSDLVLDSRIGALDRSLGFVFGAARGFLLMVVALLFFNWFVPEEKQPTWIFEAKSRHLLESTGNALVSALPDDPEKAIMDQFKQGSAPKNTEGRDEEAGYSAAERQGIGQLSETGGQ